MKPSSTAQSVLSVDVNSALERVEGLDDQVTGSWRFREEWSLHLSRRLNDTVFVSSGFPIPSNIRISCGVPSSGRLPRSKRIAAVTYDPSCSSDGTYEIAINPLIDNSIRVAAALGEQFVYIVNGLDQGHDASFKHVAKAVDLHGRAQQMVPGSAFKRVVEAVIDEFGPYPHAALKSDTDLENNGDGSDTDAVSTAPRKQKARLVKAQCAACGLTIRLARKWIDNRRLVCPDAHCTGHNRMLMIG